MHSIVDLIRTNYYSLLFQSDIVKDYLHVSYFSSACVTFFVIVYLYLHSTEISTVLAAVSTSGSVITTNV